MYKDAHKEHIERKRLTMEEICLMYNWVYRIESCLHELYKL